jgi:hypothetical protein
VSHAHLHTKLPRPLPTKDGATLRIIQDVCDYMAAIGKEREQRRHQAARGLAMFALPQKRTNSRRVSKSALC